MDKRHDPSRRIIAPTGTKLSCKSWLTEAPMRMLMNNLHPDVAERPEDLVVYGGIGRAARDWQCYDKIVEVLQRLEDDETLLVQSGKPVGVFKTHNNAPRVIIANSNLVPHWANWEHFNELDKKGLAMYGQMTAGSWIYIGSQGIVQGTYETFVAMAKQHFGGSSAGKWILTGGLGGMGGAQPLAGTMAGYSVLTCEVDETRIDFRLRTRYVDKKATTLDEALAMIVEDAHEFFKPVPVIARRLQTLMDVGLSYIRLGQAATTLSGGEAQRVKLARELSKRDTGKTLYILDEPTTGLHFHDIQQLLVVLHRLRDHGNTVVVIEHNLDVIKTADWIIDLGPEGGQGGGEIIASGTPEDVAQVEGSHTARFLKPMLKL